jgi:hypothetical protein
MERQVRKPSLSSPKVGDDSGARRPARFRDLSSHVMGLLGRRNAEPGMLPVAGRDDLVRVPEEAAAEMVNDLAMKTSTYVDGGAIEDDVARALSMSFPLITQREAPTQETLVVAQSVARFGFMARVAEWEMLTTARAPVGWMLAGLRGAVRSSVAEELKDGDDGEKSFYAALGEVTAFFVRREPVDVPYDADEGFLLMWTIPGVGGDVRASLREKTLPMALQSHGEGLNGNTRAVEGATVEDLQRVWKYGFLLRSFGEFFRGDH